MVVFLSITEATSFIDVHHDLLMFTNSLFAYDGLIPYKDFYIQYGVVQPYLTALAFYIFGVNLFSQNIIIISAYFGFLVLNFWVVKRYTNLFIGALYLFLLISVEPYVILPWANFLMGFFAIFSIFLLMNFFDKKDENFLYGFLFCCLLQPLIRSNGGLIFSVISLVCVSFYTWKNFNFSRLIKLILASFPIAIIGYLLFMQDYILQAFVLPKEYIVPLYFKLPNDFYSLLNLHWQLFFIEPNLSSVVTPTPVLWFWRFVLILGLMCTPLLMGLLWLRAKSGLKQAPGIFYVISSLFLVGISLSSSNFPIFDGFRAINAWFSFCMIILILAFQIAGFNLNIRRGLQIVLLFGIFVFVGINLSSNTFSAYLLAKKFNIENFVFQFKDLRQPEKFLEFDEQLNQNGLSKIANKNFISSLDRGTETYKKIAELFSVQCKNKSFLSTSGDFMVYLLMPDISQHLAHKMYFSQFVKLNNGSYVDINSKLYPDFLKVLDSQSGLCIFTDESLGNYFENSLKPFRDKLRINHTSVLLIR